MPLFIVHVADPDDPMAATVIAAGDAYTGRHETREEAFTAARRSWWCPPA
jgi:hypothetical protein